VRGPRTDEDRSGRWLTTSSPEFLKRSVERATRLVSLVLVALASLGLISTIVQWSNGSSAVVVYIAILGALSAIVIAFLLNRTAHVRSAGVIAASVPTLGGLAVVVADPTDPGWFAFMALNPLLGRLFLPLRWSAPLAAVNLAAVVVAVVVVPGIDDATAIVAVVFNGIVFVLFLAGIVYHEATERDRRRASSERLQLAETILEGTFGGMAVLRRDVVVEANTTFLAQFGPDENGAIGEPIGRFFGRSALAVIDAVADKEGSRPVEVEAIRLDGSTFDVEVLVRRTAVDGEDAVVLAVRDVTERKLAEAALRRAERTESIARLAAVAAHDANNELLVISLLSDELAGHQASAGAVMDSVGQIEAATERAATLMRRVLLFDRPNDDEAGPVDIARFIDDNAVTWRHVLGSDIELRIDPLAGDGLVQIEPCKLAQVLLNLVLNARDAISGVGVVTVGTSAVTIGASPDGPRVDLPHGRYHRVSVGDTGPGVPEEHLPHAFDAFYTTKDDGAGSGLGLYASRESVREVGGEITIDTSDTGTTVIVYLPESPALAATA